MPDVFDSLRSAIEHAKSEGATEPGDKAPVLVADLEAWLAEAERLQFHVVEDVFPPIHWKDE